MIRWNDFVAFLLAAGFLNVLVSLHFHADLLDLLAVQRLFAETDFKAIVFGGIVARRNLNTAVDIEVKKRKIKQWRRANADVIHVQPRRSQSFDHRLGIGIGRGPAVTSYGHS